MKIVCKAFVTATLMFVFVVVSHMGGVYAITGIPPAAPDHRSAVYGESLAAIHDCYGYPKGTIPGHSVVYMNGEWRYVGDKDTGLALDRHHPNKVKDVLYFCK